MENVEAIRMWYLDWCKKPATTTALDGFRAIDSDARSIDITQVRIVRACFNAAHYKLELDPGEIYRAEIAKQRREMPKLQKAAKTLAEAALQNHRGLDWASAIAVYNSGLCIAPISQSELDLIDANPAANIHINREPRNGHLGMYDYFSHLEKALKGKLPEIHGGPFTYKSSKGNLSFNKHISRGKKITTETMLAFELAFYLRMHTAGRADDGWQNGQSMPDDGNPCFHIVALFCDAVFDLKGNYEPNQIGDKVRDLKNAGLTEWKGVNSV